MAAMDKLWCLLGIKEPDEEEEVEIPQSSYDRYEEELLEEPVPLRRSSVKAEDPVGQRKTNLVSLDGGQKHQTKMMILEPKEFGDVRSFVTHLRNKRSLVLRLGNLEPKEAQRVVDFMSGAAFALDGSTRKLGEGIFCFAPSSVVIEGDSEPSELDDLWKG